MWENSERHPSRALGNAFSCVTKVAQALGLYFGFLALRSPAEGVEVDFQIWFASSADKTLDSFSADFADVHVAVTIDRDAMWQLKLAGLRTLAAPNRKHLPGKRHVQALVCPPIGDE